MACYLARFVEIPKPCVHICPTFLLAHWLVGCPLPEGPRIPRYRSHVSDDLTVSDAVKSSVIDRVYEFRIMTVVTLLQQGSYRVTIVTYELHKICACGSRCTPNYFSSNVIG
jgi:hypothetical protein